VIAPRGEFGAGALSLKKTKKVFFIFLFRCLFRSKRIIWHASSPGEAANINDRIGLTARIVVREDNTELPMKATRAVSGGSILRAVSLGRLVPVKGIEELLLSLRHVRIPLTLDIYGPEEDFEYAGRCRMITESLPEHVTVNFRGAIDGAAVRETLLGYELLLFPSRGENFSHVIAEALSASLPVMCTDVTPWTDRLNSGGGVILPDNAIETWTAAVTKYAALSVAERFARRQGAASAYENWRATAADRHIFEMVLAPEA
jgi:glycosyltransferase involved in cell wall biosynthesis